MATSKQAQDLQDIVWNGTLPLEVRLSPSECRVYDQAESYFIQCPRLSYLPFLLPRLKAFFVPSLIDPDVPANDGWFSFENVPLKWHYPLGLLYDLFSGAAPSQAPGPGPRHEESMDEESSLPWRITLHFTEWPDDQLVRLDPEGRVMHDAYINSVKEADFLRNGTAKGIMSLSKDDSTQLWKAVQDCVKALKRRLWPHADTAHPDDPKAFKPISQKLMYAQGAPLRHIPMKIYLPSSPSASEPTSSHLRVLQSLITPVLAGTREPQSLGTALHAQLPTLFPSRRTPILAKPVLHGSVVPMTAPVEELLRTTAYLDGWLHLGVIMMG